MNQKWTTSSFPFSSHLVAIVETSFLLALVTMTLTWSGHGLPKEKPYQVERLGSSDLGSAERLAELSQCLFQRTCKILKILFRH